MKIKQLILSTVALLILALGLASCGQGSGELDGKYIATFELNGGTLDYKTSSSRTSVNFAYHPGTYLLDPAEIPGYKLYRSGYEFTGWYTSKDCKPQEKWDFDADTFNTESLTLYAGWELAIKHTFTVCYVDGGVRVDLGEYKVSAGEEFEDWRGFADDRDGYTPIGFFSDPELTTPWDFTVSHPGGEGDLDIPVYVSYLEGEWTLVSTGGQLYSAINNGSNVYLTADVDCGGEELSFKSYGGILQGNGFTVSNLTVPKSGALSVSCALFDTLEDGAEVRNVSFEGVSFILTGVSESAAQRGIKIAALALSADGATVENVKISGAVTTNYEGELTRLNEAVYDVDSTCTVSGFTASITVTVEASDPS